VRLRLASRHAISRYFCAGWTEDDAHSTAERRYVVETMAGGGVALFELRQRWKLDIRSQ